jgi:hypothetical protein
MKTVLIISLALVSVLLTPFTPLRSGPGVPGPEGNVAEGLARAVDVYLDGEFDSGIIIINELLSRQNLSANDSIAILEVKSIITYAKGEMYKREAYGYLQSISKIGHCLVNLPR